MSPSRLASTIAAIVGGWRNAPVQCSASMMRHSSSASARGTKTLVPPATKVASVVLNVPTWKSGPALRYTSSALTPAKSRP